MHKSTVVLYATTKNPIRSVENHTYLIAKVCSVEHGSDPLKRDWTMPVFQMHEVHEYLPRHGSHYLPES
jgi:hypothetical protein